MSVELNSFVHFHDSVFCRKVRLIDVEEFHNTQESMELSVFQHLVIRHIESAKDILLKKYVNSFLTCAEHGQIQP